MSTDQGAYDTRKEVTHMFGWDKMPEKVVVETMLVGVGFGGKEDVSAQHLAALAAVHFQRAIKCRFTRQESIDFHPKRHCMYVTFTLGCDKDGMLTGLDCEANFDIGAYASLCGPVLERACTHAVGPYTYQNTDIRGFGYYTNNPPAGAFRGFGVRQTEFALVTCIGLLAEKAHISPWEMRYRNTIDPDKVLPNGQIADCSTALKETLLAVKDVYEKNEGHAGIACAMKNLGVGLPDAAVPTSRSSMAVRSSTRRPPISARAATRCFCRMWQRRPGFRSRRLRTVNARPRWRPTPAQRRARARRSSRARQPVASRSCCVMRCLQLKQESLSRKARYVPTATARRSSTTTAQRMTGSAMQTELCLSQGTASIRRNRSPRLLPSKATSSAMSTSS
jgi:hypothetical protein